MERTSFCSFKRSVCAVMYFCKFLRWWSSFTECVHPYATTSLLLNEQLGVFVPVMVVVYYVCV